MPLRDRADALIERAMATLCRLLTLLAVLLAPLAMQPAAAVPVQHHASMPMRHCPEQAPKHDTKGGIAECTMACSAALPAFELAQEQPSQFVCEPTAAAAAPILHGLHPDPATPPPKRA